MLLSATSFNDLDLPLRSQEYENTTTCAVTVFMWHEVAQTFMMIVYVRIPVDLTNMDG